MSKHIKVRYHGLKFRRENIVRRVREATGQTVTTIAAARKILRSLRGKVDV